MPTLFHSRLQRNLVNAINRQTSTYEAIQELRSIVPPMSPVPDISVVKRDRLSTEDGPLQEAPDWLIEIRSPDHNTLELQNKILHCLGHGTQSPTHLPLLVGTASFELASSHPIYSVILGSEV